MNKKIKKAVEINVTTLTKQINEGMKKVDLAAYYGIPVSQMGVAIKSAGLRVRSFKQPSFVLVTENKEEVVSEVEIVVDETSTVESVQDTQQEARELSEVPTWNN